MWLSFKRLKKWDTESFSVQRMGKPCHLEKIVERTLESAKIELIIHRSTLQRILNNLK